MNTLNLVLVCLVLNFGLIACTSSGLLISVCDAESSLYGCSQENFIDGDRLNCSETTQIMNWVVKPVSTDDYTLTLGLNENEPVTKYQQDQLINVHIRTNAFGSKIRGVLLYAADSEGNRVGSWEFTNENPSYWQHAPAPCEKTVLHATGVEKPYHLNNLYFRAPSEWVGTIYFKCLLKIGEANTGYFYWPKGTVENNIKLDQDDTPVDESHAHWFKSDLGSSCTETCALEGKFCNINITKTITTKQAIIDNIMPRKLPLLASCDNLGATSSSDGYCYYDDTEEICTQYNTPYEETTCDSFSANEMNGYRWCYCDGEITTSSIPETTSESKPTGSNQPTGSDQPTKSSTPQDTDKTDSMNTEETSVPKTSEVIVCTGNTDCDSGICQQDGTCYVEEINNNSANSLTLFHSLVIGIFGVLFQQKTSKLFLVCFVISIFISGSNAHNWMNSPGRSQGTASTRKPCLPKLSNLPHVQVGSMQEFLVEWKTGHTDSVGMFITAHESSYNMFTQHTITYGQTYLDETPAGVTDLATQSHYQRYYRGFKAHANEVEYTESDPEWIDVPDAFINTPNRLSSYQTKFIENDRFVEYENPNFPHIESLRKHVTAEGMGGQNIDTAWQFIEGKQGPGRYIVHYVWGGYRDCIEVDLMDYVVDFPYGIGSDGAVYTTIPHCFFEDARRAPSQGRRQCLDCMLEAARSFVLCDAGGLGECGGIQIAPYNTPDSVNPLFREYGENMIPWDDVWCNETLPMWQSHTEEELKGAHVCRIIVPRTATTTKFVYETSEDPSDPIFYSSCIYRTSVRIFEGYGNETDNSPDTDGIDGNGWRYQDQCISCENKAKNEVASIPTYELTDRCVNCDLKPATLEEPYILLPLQGPNMRVHHLKSGNEACNETSSTQLCGKYLGSLSTAIATVYTGEECARLAANDPECTEYVSWRKGFNSFGCVCRRNLDCCGELRTRSAEGSTVYRMTKASLNIPDPECNTGIVNDNVCCSVRKGVRYACITQQNCTDSAPPCFL